VNPEVIYTSFHLACKIFRRPQGLNNGFLNKEGSNIHPTQKPIELYEWLLRTYAEKGQRVLDTHLGSGSSAIACHHFGCPFVGCEIDPEYYEKTIERIKRQMRQARLFS
jgi:site-specific DNA-methyltransferase (adenine-specific)